MRAIRFALLIIIIGFTQGAHALGDEARRAIADWFKANNSEIHHIVDILLQHPGISHVNDIGIELMAEYQELTRSDVEAYRHVKELGDAMSIQTIAVAREGGTQSGQLISIRMNLYSEGFAFSDSYLVALGYYPDPDIVDQLETRGYSFVKLRDGWYIVEIRK